MHLDLGNGHQACLIWRDGTDRSAGIPMGMIEMHGRCRTYVTWADADSGWQLASLRPLTVTPALTCPGCGMMGTIAEGRYVERTSLTTGGGL